MKRYALAAVLFGFLGIGCNSNQEFTVSKIEIFTPYKASGTLASQRSGVEQTETLSWESPEIVITDPEQAPVAVTEISVPQGSYKKLDFQLTWDSVANLPTGVLRTLSIKGKLTPKVDKVKVQMESGDEFSCNQGVEATLENEILRIDFTKLTSLLNCDFSEKDEWNVDSIGQSTRKVSNSKTGFLGALKFNFYSQAQEQSMGYDFYRQFNDQYGYAVLPSYHPTSEYVQRMMEKIVANSDTPGLTPRVYVINANILNAFAVPGGYVYVFRGLIDAAQNESQLMSVLGHEWAHVTARHSTKQMSWYLRTTLAQIGASALVDRLAKKSDTFIDDVLAEVFNLSTQILQVGFFFKNSRQAESEADRLGTQYAYRSGWDPTGIAGMFEVFRAKDPHERSSLEDILSSHPSHDERISANYDFATFFLAPHSSYEVNSSEFLSAKENILSMGAVRLDESRVLGLQFMNTYSNIAKSSFDLKLRDLMQKKSLLGKITSALTGGSNKDESKKDDSKKEDSSKTETKKDDFQFES